MYKFSVCWNSSITMSNDTQKSRLSKYKCNFKLMISKGQSFTSLIEDLRQEETKQMDVE